VLKELPYRWRREDYGDIRSRRGNILAVETAVASDD